QNMLDYVDHRFRFFGYGDPGSRLWMVGIEEAACRTRPGVNAITASWNCTQGPIATTRNYPCRRMGVKLPYGGSHAASRNRRVWSPATSFRTSHRLREQGCPKNCKASTRRSIGNA